MMNKVFCIACVLLLLSIKGLAQSATFVHLSSDAEALSRGNTDLCSSESPFSIFSGFYGSRIDEHKLSLGYGFRGLNENDYSLHSVALSYRLASKHVLGVGVKLFSHPGYDQYDNNGVFLKSFSPREQMFTIGYSYLLSEDLSISLMGNLIDSDLDGSNNATAYTFNAGVNYRKQNWSAALGLQQLGSKLKYEDNSYNVPARLNFALLRSFNFSERHKIEGGFQAKYQFLPSDYEGMIANVGAEYSYKDIWFLRAGHQFASEKVESGFSSCGVGVQYWGLKLSCAYLMSDDEYLDKNLSISVSYFFE